MIEQESNEVKTRIENRQVWKRKTFKSIETIEITLKHLYKNIKGIDKL